MSEVEQKLKEAVMVADAICLNDEERTGYIIAVVERIAPELAVSLVKKKESKGEKFDTYPTSKWIQDYRLNLTVEKFMSDCKSAGLVVEKRKNANGRSIRYYAISDDTLKNNHIRYGENRFAHPVASTTTIYWTEEGFRKVCEMFGYFNLQRKKATLS